MPTCAAILQHPSTSDEYALVQLRLAHHLIDIAPARVSSATPLLSYVLKFHGRSASLPNAGQIIAFHFAVTGRVPIEDPKSWQSPRHLTTVHAEGAFCCSFNGQNKGFQPMGTA